jgi:hypothetical protein
MFLGSRERLVRRADRLAAIAQAVRRWLLTSQSWVQCNAASYTTGLWVCFSGGGGGRQGRRPDSPSSTDIKNRESVAVLYLSAWLGA